MICVKCAADKHEVIRTDRNRTASGKFSETTDMRVYRCQGCGLVTYVDCKVTSVEVFNGRRVAAQSVGLDEYRKNWLPAELAIRPKRPDSLFGGDDND